MKWKAPFTPIRRLTPDEQRMGIPIGKASPGLCRFCLNPRNDTCYNCEKSICNLHARPFVFLATSDGRPLMVFGICPECVKDNELDDLP